MPGSKVLQAQQCLSKLTESLTWEYDILPWGLARKYGELLAGASEGAVITEKLAHPAPQTTWVIQTSY